MANLHRMTAHRPMEKLRSERPVLHCRRVTPVRQKDGQSRTRRAAKFAVDLVERSERQFRAIGEAIVPAKLLGENQMRAKKFERSRPVKIVFSVGRIRGQHARRTGLFTARGLAIENLLGAADDRPHQMLEGHREAGATCGPIEQEKGNGGRAERVTALADGKAHLVGLDAEFLRERLAQRDDKRVGARAAKRVLQLKFENVGGDFEAERDVSLYAERLVVTRA